jgi:hypothetical protein
MTQTPLAMHDALLMSAPDGARHDSDICPFCVEWSMTSEGIPSGFSRLDEASQKAPYGDVKYADPGLQADKVKRYPIDTEAHARAAWSYINQAENAEKYSPEDLTKVRKAIESALQAFGVGVTPEDVQAVRDHQVKTAKEEQKLLDKQKAKSTSKKSDAASEGGTDKQMDTITQETHEALLEKALKDATTALETAKAELEAKVAELSEKASQAEGQVTALTTENERVNSELDTAQVALKAATDEANALKADIAAKEAEAQKAEIATARATEVRNLGLFSEEFITERASKWAEVDEAAWTERLDEWKVAKGASAPTASATTETASAMTGTNDVTTGQSRSARRAILGLGN